MTDGSRARAVLFTDVDGTLLDHHTYDPGPSIAAVGSLLASGVDVVLCSNKTAGELKAVCDVFGVRLPFIAENGAVVYDVAGNPVRRVGMPVVAVRTALRREAAAAHVMVRAFGAMTDGEIADVTGLSLEAAARAAAREHSEPFLVTGGTDRLADLEGGLRAQGIRLIRGARFLTAVGGHDKADAVRWWLDNVEPTLPSFAVGDGPNDLGMLGEVDVPIVVRGHDGRWIDAAVPSLVRVDGVGPAGFAMAAARVVGLLEFRGERSPTS